MFQNASPISELAKCIVDEDGIAEAIAYFANYANVSVNCNMAPQFACKTAKLIEHICSPTDVSFQKQSTVIVANRLIGDDGARPEVGWVPLAMDEPPVPWQVRETVH